jgi:hypothetical protein
VFGTKETVAVPPPVGVMNVEGAMPVQTALRRFDAPLEATISCSFFLLFGEE